MWKQMSSKFSKKNSDRSSAEQINGLMIPEDNYRHFPNATLLNFFGLMPEPKKIFISYAREDSESAEKIYGDLKQHGFEPWLDEENLLADQNWRQMIRKAIRDSDYIAILICSGWNQSGFERIWRISRFRNFHYSCPYQWMWNPVQPWTSSLGDM